MKKIIMFFIFFASVMAVERVDWNEIIGISLNEPLSPVALTNLYQQAVKHKSGLLWQNLSYSVLSLTGGIIMATGLSNPEPKRMIIGASLFSIGLGVSIGLGYGAIPSANNRILILRLRL